MLSKIESVAFNVCINFGLAGGTPLLPAVANTFYYIESLTFHHNNFTGVPQLVITTNSGQATGGTIAFFYKPSNNPENVFKWEVDSMTYNVNTHSAGTLYIFGTVFKITTA